MSFNELNSVENYIIKQLTGVNLNTNEVAEDTKSYSGFWQYKSAQDLQRSINEVLLKAELKNEKVKFNMDEYISGLKDKSYSNKEKLVDKT